MAKDIAMVAEGQGLDFWPCQIAENGLLKQLDQLKRFSGAVLCRR